MGTCAIKKQSISRLDFASIKSYDCPQSPTLIFKKRKDQTPDFRFVDEIISSTNIIEENYLKYYRQIDNLENVNLRKNFLLVQHILTNQIYFAEVLDKTDQTISYINLICNIHHPNIQDLNEIFYHNQQYVVIKQYCNGGNLEQLLRNENKLLSPNQQLKVLKQIFQVINYLHQEHITHGSLTIRSFELEDQSDDLKIQLVDLDQVLNESKQHKIKSHYSSPQIANAFLQNEVYDPQQSDDVWALAIIGIKIVFNQFLYEGNSLRHILENISNNVRQPIEIINTTHHYLADELFSKMLEQNETQRIDLQQILDAYWMQSILEIHSTTLTNKKIIHLCHIFLYMMAEIFNLPKLSYLDQLRPSKKISRFQLGGLIQKNFKHIYSQSDSLCIANQVFKDAQNITYFELIAKFTDKKSLITESRVNQAFKRFCNNQDVIQIDDVLPFFQGKEQELKQAFENIENSQINQNLFQFIMFSYLKL